MKFISSIGLNLGKRKKSNAATDVVKDTSDMYSAHVLSVTKMSNVIFQLSDKSRSNRQQTFDIKGLGAVIETELRLTVREVHRKIKQQH